MVHDFALRPNNLVGSDRLCHGGSKPHRAARQTERSSTCSTPDSMRGRPTEILAQRTPID
ncbi:MULTISPECIES: hypothetical protein [Streptomyces]|uniref:Uncharacterized protein n=1 Tax=Streptomyces nigra TaxID=1827580 RepID=A0ABZ1J147_9ACTN|nr:hypothetical protein [Streptomyces sp. RK62]MBQ1000489.1 hypothetical protein [Streptomyces sp. RK62]